MLSNLAWLLFLLGSAQSIALPGSSREDFRRIEARSSETTTVMSSLLEGSKMTTTTGAPTAASASPTSVNDTSTPSLPEADGRTRMEASLYQFTPLTDGGPIQVLNTCRTGQEPDGPPPTRQGQGGFENEGFAFDTQMEDPIPMPKIAIVNLDPCSVFEADARDSGVSTASSTGKEPVFFLNMGGQQVNAEFPSSGGPENGQLVVKSEDVFAVPDTAYRIANLECGLARLLMFSPVADLAEQERQTSRILDEHGNGDERFQLLTRRDGSYPAVEECAQRCGGAQSYIAQVPVAAGEGFQDLFGVDGEEDDDEAGFGGNFRAVVGTALGKSASVKPFKATSGPAPARTGTSTEKEPVAASSVTSAPPAKRNPNPVPFDRNEDFNSKFRGQLPPITKITRPTIGPNPPIGYPVPALPYVKFVGPGRNYRVYRPLQVPLPPRVITGGGVGPGGPGGVPPRFGLGPGGVAGGVLNGVGGGPLVGVLQDVVNDPNVRVG